MKVEYFAQPETQLGVVLSDLLDTDPAPGRIVFVSAFAGLQTIMRIKHQILDLRNRGSDIRFVLGIDLGGTSSEVLEELLGWNIDIRIVKHRIPRHTFHPKLYLFRWSGRAEIIIGSNNITEGGFFGNYEGAARILYVLPDDSVEFETACLKFQKFFNPHGPTAYELTAGFLKELIAREEIPTEAEARWGRDISARSKQKQLQNKRINGHIFGIENIEPPPPLPADVLERLVKDVRRRRRESKKVAKDATAVQLPVDNKVSDALLPAAFYMTLPTLQGRNIPGEGRIPLEAIELAKEFWGWPEEYSKSVSPRAGHERVYWNWRPIWKVWSVEEPDKIAVQEVRMYMYENSSDFRFYVRPLVNARGNLGDVVRIQRIAQPDAEYECVLARRNTAEYSEWIKYCTQSVQNSTRRFGYA